VQLGSTQIEVTEQSRGQYTRQASSNERAQPARERGRRVGTEARVEKRPRQLAPRSCEAQGAGRMLAHTRDRRIHTRQCSLLTVACALPTEYLHGGKLLRDHAVLVGDSVGGAKCVCNLRFEAGQVLQPTGGQRTPEHMHGCGRQQGSAGRDGRRGQVHTPSAVRRAGSSTRVRGPPAGVYTRTAAARPAWPGV